MTSVDAPEYTPGEWVAVVADGGVALLPPTTPSALVHRLWESLRLAGAAGPAGVVDHLQVLVRDGLATLPPFALLTLDGTRLHAVVRGAVEVEVTAAGRAFVLTAPGVSTWSDEVVEGVRTVTVRAPGDEADADATALPMAAGVARAGGVRLRPTCPLAAVEPVAVDLAAVEPVAVDLVAVEPVAVEPVAVDPAPAVPVTALPSVTAAPAGTADPSRGAVPSPVGSRRPRCRTSCRPRCRPPRCPRWVRGGCSCGDVGVGRCTGRRTGRRAAPPRPRRGPRRR
ncbi:hypothetical protein [Cellulomonas sp. ATA003]|uniref:hypothetical protein n=1 Tax=Cellulomonas sp. ATA003 TaxID=3073064 RepID=UPI002873928C|nr:hypothetical protein [Cellulomonas sp. ATA003]WNB85961.1 hypothetical protein REH70_01210 [Cellulomonas sp. ATA003]